MIEELDQIQAMSHERLYKWLHSLAGLHLNFSEASDTKMIGKKPTFAADVCQVAHLVSSKSIV